MFLYFTLVGSDKVLINMDLVLNVIPGDTPGTTRICTAREDYWLVEGGFAEICDYIVRKSS